MKNLLKIKTDILKLLDDKKAVNIIEIDISECNSRLSDICIIGSGTSSMHMQSVADYIYRDLKLKNMKPITQGTAKSGWVLIESYGIEIHLFKPELRDYYDLETIMKEGKRPVG